RPQHGMARQAVVTAAQGQRGPTRRQVVWSAIALVIAGGFGLDTWLQREVQAAAQRPMPLGMREFGAAIAEQSTVTPAPKSTVAATSNRGATTAAAQSAPTASTRPFASAAPAAAPAQRTASTVATASTTPTAAPAPIAPSAGATAPMSGARAATTADAPSSAGAIERGEATASITPSTRPATDAALTRIADLINRGRSHEAMLALAQFLRAQPRHADARSTLAALQAERGQREAALLTLLEGVAIEPERFAALAARLQADLGDVPGALATLTSVPPALRDGHHFALEGGLALRAHAPERAREAYGRALAAPNADPLWWIGLALAHEALGDDGAARRALTHAAAAPALPADVRAFVNQRLAALHGAPAPAADAVAQQSR
ncbi:MAG TPA: hypothetical protein VFR86_19790, partial [Burkholderiaceae bacterium]|nr:hypothetical protein [Burkholderiaceae bacterium]